MSLSVGAIVGVTLGSVASIAFVCYSARHCLNEACDMYELIFGAILPDSDFPPPSSEQQQRYNEATQIPSSLVIADYCSEEESNEENSRSYILTEEMPPAVIHTLVQSGSASLKTKDDISAKAVVPCFTL